MSGKAKVGAPLALAIVLGAGGMAQASIYTGSGGALVDAGTAPGVAVFSIMVGDVGTISSFNGVTLTSLAHTWVGDVQVLLTLPDATTISLVDRIGYTGTLFGDSSNYAGNYVFADGGADIWAIATDPGHGNTYNIAAATYAATGAGSGAPINLNALLAGKNINGLWTLTITDFESGDTGGLEGWSLDIATIPEPGTLGALLVLVAWRPRRR